MRPCAARNAISTIARVASSAHRWWPIKLPIAPHHGGDRMSATENDAILKVLYGYYEAFGRNSAQASGFFGEPIMVISPENVVILGTRAELATFFEKVVATILGPNGYSHSKVGECHV